jgi:hypothetical protein
MPDSALVGRVSGVVIVSGGSGYTAPPFVAFAPPNGENGRTATGLAEVSNGAIVSIEIIDAGAGYDLDNPPTIEIGGPNTDGQAASGVVQLEISS